VRGKNQKSERDQKGGAGGFFYEFPLERGTARLFVKAQEAEWGEIGGLGLCFGGGQRINGAGCGKRNRNRDHKGGRGGDRPSNIKLTSDGKEEKKKGLGDKIALGPLKSKVWVDEHRLKHNMRELKELHTGSIACDPYLHKKGIENVLGRGLN